MDGIVREDCRLSASNHRAITTRIFLLATPKRHVINAASTWAKSSLRVTTVDPFAQHAGRHASVVREMPRQEGSVRASENQWYDDAQQSPETF